MQVLHRNLINNFLIIKTLATSELKIRYKRNILGFFWSLLNPLLNIGLISVVFSKLMEMPYKEFVIFLLPGLMAWNLFINIINSCTVSIINNERLIKNLSINKLIFPMVAATTAFIDFILAFFSLLLLFVTLFSSNIHLTILILPLSIALLTLFALGIGTIISIIAVCWRDISHIINVLLQILFFLTPIVYQKSRLVGYEYIMNLNPVVHFIDLFREPIYYGRMPNLSTFIICTCLAITTFLASCLLLRKTENGLIFRL